MTRLAAFAVLLFAVAAFADEPAKPAAGAKAEKVAIYDESAVASEQIEKAVAKAKRENRRVLLQWGSNSCYWCRLLHEKCRSDKEIAKKLLYEYDVVLVDLGAAEKNKDLVAKYGIDLSCGIPYLTVLDADGKVLVNQETSSLETKEPKGHDAKKVLDFLTAHQTTPLKADVVFADGLARAVKENKRVFLHFGAPTCGWCHRLDDWMAKPEVAAILGKDFVDVKIDIDRMPGAAEIQKKYDPAGGGGIPWFVFLDATGKALSDSNADPDRGSASNIGFPAKPEEIAHFSKMLAKAKQNLTESDIAVLAKSLETDKKAAH